jgi:hypothetical protein
MKILLFSFFVEIIFHVFLRFSFFFSLFFLFLPSPLLSCVHPSQPERLVGASYSYPADVWGLGLALATAALGRVPIDASKGHWGLVHHIQVHAVAAAADDDA